MRAIHLGDSEGMALAYYYRLNEAIIPPTLSARLNSTFTRPGSAEDKLRIPDAADAPNYTIQDHG